VASERQIAANQANAGKSTGPRSSAGKRRASRNAYRHGLSVSVGASAPLAPELEKRARQIAGNTDDTFTLERAREIAQAELDLARVRRAKVAIIERAQALAAADRPLEIRNLLGATRAFRCQTKHSRGQALQHEVSSAPGNAG
jgi:hypothetical protein